MNLYTRNLRWKYFLIFGAVLIGLGSLYYTNQLVKKLSHEEHKKVLMVGDATRLIQTIDANLPSNISNFLLRVLENNETVPVIVVDNDENILAMRNIDSVHVKNERNTARLIAKMKDENEPIEIDLGGNDKLFLYYRRSTILESLAVYPFIQLSVIILFIVIAYLAFSTSRKAEQNQVWLGLTKETAHQLGTPISSLMAWKELLKLKTADEQLTRELEKDIHRLEIITERFSKIGSKPVLKPENIKDVLNEVIDYLRTRSSDKISFVLKAPDEPVILPLNPALFEWVIENTCKNSMDAIEGKGSIIVDVTDHEKFVSIDITDTGKGIARNRQKTIFKPGYTTKERGWGLGLSLTKRIIEEYHKGKIFVASSEIGVGTTLRILLNR